MSEQHALEKMDFDNGLVRIFHPVTDGGGEWMRWYLAQQIREHGLKKKYNRCYEWCSGSSPMGFHIFDQGLIDNLVLVDNFDLAISDCNQTIKFNKLEDKVVTHKCDRVQDIPQGELWDLVIANPPHCWVSNPAIKENEFLGRILLDENLETHKEFFNNIASRLADDGELFIIEHMPNFAGAYPDIISDVGLKYLGEHTFNVALDPLPPGLSDRKTLPEMAGRPEVLQWSTMHFVKGD